jgi:hypothetical protein
MLKLCCYCNRHLRAERRGPFSLERGLDPIYVFFKLSITFLCEFLKLLSQNDKGDPVGSPSLQLLCG